MKNIIVPTDFSKNAKDALKYAINLANHFGSTIHLIHIYEVRTRAGMLVSIKDFLQKEAETELSNLIKETKDRLLHGTSIKAKAIEGYGMDTVTAYAKAKTADLIVMGTQGSSALAEVFFGSSTIAVIKNSTCPVLAIPANYEYAAPRLITLAVDEKRISKAKALEPMIALINAYRSKVKVLHIEKGSGFAIIDPTIDEHLKDIDFDFSIITDSQDINQSMNQYVKESKTDLLCLLHRERNFLENLFHKSVTIKEAFDSPVPLLILKE